MGHSNQVPDAVSVARSVSMTCFLLLGINMISCEKGNSDELFAIDSKKNIVTQSWALGPWIFYPYSGPDNGEDSIFHAALQYKPDISCPFSLKINAVYFSYKGGDHIKVENVDAQRADQEYGYFFISLMSSSTPTDQCSNIVLSYSQRDLSKRPLADSIHLEIIQ